MSITLQHLVNRVNFDTWLLEKHPEQKEMLERHIKETKDLIAKSVIENDGNPTLNKICAKD